MATAQTVRPEQQGFQLVQSISGPLLPLPPRRRARRRHLRARVLVLRCDRVEHRHFRVPAVVPVLGIASCVLLLTQQEGRVWSYGLGLLLVGVVLFGVARLTSRRRRAPHADADEREGRS